MKLFATLALLLVSTPALAHVTFPATLTCNNGYMEDDRLFQVEITKDSVKFETWESALTVSRSSAVVDGNAMAIVSKVGRGYAEDEQISGKINALLVYNAKAKTLNVAEVDDAHTNSQVLKCK